MVYSVSINPTRESQVNDAFCLTSQIHLIEQLFMSDPGFSPILLQWISQIDTWKYVDLSDPLAVNMVHLDPKQQLLLDGWFVLVTPLKKQHWHSEDLTAGQVFTGSHQLFAGSSGKIPFPLNSRFSPSITNLMEKSRLCVIMPFANMLQLHSWLICQPGMLSY